MLLTRRILLVGFLCASLLGGGCATTLLYNHADWLIGRQLDSYFDLTRSQKAFVSSKLDRILSGHRHEALPRYETVLQQAGARVQHGLSAEDLEWAFAQYDELRTDLFGRFAPDGAEFVRLVSDQQVSRLKKALQSRLAREEGLLRETAHQRLLKRTERILVLAKEWLGPLTKQQEQEITRLSMNFPDTLPVWYDHQLQRHEQLIAIIEARNSADTPARLREWLVKPDESADSRFIDATRQLRQRISDLALTLDRLATSEQRRHVISKLGELTHTVHKLRQA